MTKFHSTPPDAVLVAIDMSKHRQEVLLERPEGGPPTPYDRHGNEGGL